MLILTDACYHPLVTSRSFIELSGIDIPPSTPWAFYLLVLTNILNSAEISCEMWDEKGVDVHIAVAILVAAYENLADRIILVSSDTDLIPAIAKIIALLAMTFP